MLSSLYTWDMVSYSSRINSGGAPPESHPEVALSQPTFPPGSLRPHAEPLMLSLCLSLSLDYGVEGVKGEEGN